MSQPQKPAAPGQGWLIIRFLLIGTVVLGGFLILFSLVKPHYTGTVISRGRISQVEGHGGMRRRSSSHHYHYSSDVKVRQDNSNEIVTVYYRVPDLETIPQVGDLIQYTGSIVGNVPYPNLLLVQVGGILIAIPALIFFIRFLCLRKKGQGR
jgi:hypothetical protein